MTSDTQVTIAQTKDHKNNQAATKQLARLHVLKFMSYCSLRISAAPSNMLFNNSQRKVQPSAHVNMKSFICCFIAGNHSVMLVLAGCKAQCINAEKTKPTA